MAGVLPANVSFFMQRLQGVSTSQFKVFPQSSDNATSGKIIRFELPSNSLVNLRNTRMFFNVATAGSGTSLPNDISSLIERVAVYMGGVLVQNNFQHYNVLKHAKSAIKGYKCNAALGHPEIVRSVSYHDGTIFANTDPEKYDDKDDQFCIDNWEGLLGSIEPSIIDTGICPQITLEITLGDDTVCPISEGRVLPDGTGATANHFDKTGSGNPTYSLSNLSLQVEVLGMATSVLDQIVEQRIASVGYLSLPFKNYYTFTSTHTGTSRFNVNSASWDRLWLTYRDTGYATKSAPQIATGYKKAGAFVDDTAAQTAADIDIGRPTYDIGGVLGTNEEKYISKYFKFQEKIKTSGTPAYHQLQVNSASVPAYRMTTPEALSMTFGAVDGEVNKMMTLDQYKKDKFIMCYRFCLPESDFNRLASGLDTRSVSAMGSVETENIDSTNLTMFAECTAELRIGSGRAIEIIS